MADVKNLSRRRVVQAAGARSARQTNALSAWRNFFENIGFERSPKLLLLVSNFNLQAKRLYHEMGYKEIGVINGLFREGISEYIMMKSKKNDV